MVWHVSGVADVTFIVAVVILLLLLLLLIILEIVLLFSPGYPLLPHPEGLAFPCICSMFGFSVHL